MLGFVYACGSDDDDGGGTGATGGTAGSAAGTAGTTTGGSSGTGGTAGKGGSGGTAGKGGSAGKGGGAGTAGEAGGATDGGSGGDDGVAGADAGGAPSAGAGGESVGGAGGESVGGAGGESIGGAGGEPSVGGAGGEPSVGGAGGEPNVGGAGGEPAMGGAAGATSTEPLNLIFSEYLESEGAVVSDALEIYNLGDEAVNLGTAGCEIEIHTAAGEDVSITRPLTGTVAAGSAFVFCPNNVEPEPAYCDLQVTVTGVSGDFSGDDVVVLVCDGAVQDIIGQIGEDPGTAWGTGMNTTENRTLRRECSVDIGDRDGSDEFTPATEWDSVAANTTSDLGAHTCP